MTRSELSQVSIVTSLECEEPVAALLETIVGGNAAVYSDTERQRSIVTIYAPLSPTGLKKYQKEIVKGLAGLEEFGLDTGSTNISISRVKREDWSESWKKHFKQIRIGDALLITPGWLKPRKKQSEAMVVLDPGLSFGTGQHATTSFCLEQLVRLRAL
jgi:ribosomal protein L11 methyltransferase